MHFSLLIYLLVSFGLFLFPEWLRKKTALIIAILQAAVFTFFLFHLPEILNGEILGNYHEWIPELNMAFEFRLDGLSMVFALLITGIGALVFLYAGAYMKSYQNTGKFYFYLTLFSGAMLGLVLSANLIQLFIFWEITSVLSFLLISFFHEKEKARSAAFQSLFITGFGGLSLLGGIILLGSVVDSYSFSDWIAQAEAIKSSNLYLPGLILILIGVMTKSAQFPFHFWLPGAMQAPTPVSAYLHSATMVKAGFFVLIRLSPVLGGTIEWTYIIPLTGVLTMLTGSYFAITQTDLKAILAYTTISALGILILLIGIDTELSVKAALLFLFVHAFYKATLFMVAGYIDKKTGTRDLAKLGGLISHMPVIFFVSLLALFSMAGFPPMLGFLGKEFIYEAKIQSPGIASLILVFGVTANVFMVAVSLYFLFKVFAGKLKTPVKSERSNMMYIAGPMVLALLSLIFGLFPQILGDTLIEPALREVRFSSIEVKIKHWHGFNPVFFLSLGTVILGIALFILIYKKERVLKVWRSINQKVFTLHFSEIFFSGVDRFVWISAKNTRLIQHGYNRFYILTIFLFAAILLWIQVFITRGWEPPANITLQPFYISGLIFLITLATVFSALSRSRLAVIIAMGVVGYGLSLIFLYYSGIDLAITQILAETLIVVMFVLVLQRLPRFSVMSSRLTRFRDFLIALSFGSVMTILALKAVNVDFNRPISDFFIENSLDKAFGKNVVNVILVDFRALDTMGEITVLSIAALGVYVLLTTKNNKK